MSGDHQHIPAGAGNERALTQALVLTSTFLVVEVIGGLWSGSLALISDAAHMLTDAVALAIALLAVRIARRPPDRRRTFGYHRFEILAAAFNAVLLFGVALYILVEASQRLRNPAAIESMAMLWVAVAGLAINLISMRLLRGGQAQSLNVKGAYLEVWSDMLGSVGVIAGAIVIRVTGWTWVDSAVAVAIGFWVLPRAWQLLKESTNVLLEGVPQGLALDDIAQALRHVPGVQSVHELHVWSVSSGKVSLTAHLVAPDLGRPAQEVLEEARDQLARRFDIHHVTLQVEAEPCSQADAEHRYGPAGAAGDAPNSTTHHH